MAPNLQPPDPEPEKPPKSILKRVLLAACAGMILAVLGLAWYISTMDVETYREPIASYISRATGLQVKIGSMDVDFSQGLGLRAGSVTVKTGDGKRGLFSADSLFLQAKLAPLLQGKFEVKKTSIIKPVVSLYLEAPAGKKEPEKSEKPLTKEQINIETVRKSLRDIHLTVDIIEIKDAHIHLLQPGEVRHETAIVSLNLKLQRPEPNLINALIEDLDVAINNFHLTGKASALDILAKTGAVETDFLVEPFSASDLKPLFKLLPASSRQIINKYPFSGNIRNLSLRAKAPLESLDDVSVLMKQAELNMALGLNDFSMKTASFNLALQTLDIEQTWSNGALDHKIETGFMGGKILLAGKLRMEGDDKNIIPVIDSNLQLVNVDASALKLKNDWMPNGGKISATFKVKGPVQELDKIQLDGTFSVRDLNLNPPQDKPKALVSFPKIDGKARWDNGVVDHDIQGVAFGSDFSLKGVLNLKKVGEETVPEINSNILITKLNPGLIKPIIGNQFFPDQGSLSASFHLSGPLTSLDKIRWKGTIDGEQIAIETPDGLPKASFPKIKIKGDWADNRMLYEIEGKALGGDFSTGGKVTLARKNGKTAPEINSKFEIKNIDLKPLKAIVPFDWFPAEGIFSSQFKLIGPLTNVDRLRWDGQILVDQMLLIKGQGADASRIPIPRMQIKGSWANRSLKHDIQANLFAGQAQIVGTMGLKKSASGNSSATIQSNVKLTGLNFSKAKLPWEWAPSEGLLSGSLILSGTQGDGKAVLLNGKLLGEKLIFTPEGQRHSVDRIDILAKSKSSNLTTITLDMKKIKSNQSSFKQIYAIVNQSPDAIILTKGFVHPPHGEILIKGNYNIPAKSYKFDLQGRKLRMEDFAREDVISPLMFDGTLHGTIPAKEPAARGLNGAIKFKAGKGRFHKLKIAQSILTLFNPNALTAKSGLSFDYLGGDVKIVRGLMSTRNLAMDGDQLKIKMVGTADLATQKLNMQGEAQPMQLLDSAIKNIPILGDILSGGKDGVIKTRFKVGGTFDDPQVTSDVGGQLIDGLTGK